MNKKNYCATCGGVLIRDFIRYDKHWGDQIAIFENVQAEVCPQCGEIWLDGKTVEKMERMLFKKVKPTYRITIPVWSLKRAA